MSEQSSNPPVLDVLEANGFEPVTESPVEVAPAVIETPEPILEASEEPVSAPSGEGVIEASTDLAETVEVIEPPVEVAALEVAPLPVVESPAVPVAPVRQLPLRESAIKWLQEGMAPDPRRDEYVTHFTNYTLAQLGDHVRHWATAEILRYCRSGEAPSRTASGLWPNSPIRAGYQAWEWPREELLAWLKGELRATQNAPAEALLEAVQQRWELPLAWNERQIRDYVLRNILPAKTADGLWVEDQVRQLKPAAHWSPIELKAWAGGEIAATEKAPDADLVYEARVRYGLSEDMGAKKLKTLIANRPLEAPTMAEEIIQHNLERYAREMNPSKPMTEKSAADYQQLFYHTIQRILKMEGREFTDNWTYLLDFVNSNRKTLFDTTVVFRGYSQLTLPKRECENFERLVSLLLRTSAPSARAPAAGTIGFEAVFKHIPSDVVRQKILAYYQVGA